MDLLVVDDSLEVLDLVQRALERDGHEVRAATTIAEARQRIAAAPPDVMVLDVALPDGTGIDLCRALRSEGVRCPILLLTAHGDVPKRVAGLDAGADDFLAKPFAIAELRARVRALGRRGPIDRPVAIEIADIRLDLGARRAVRGDADIPLTAREWAVIELLVARRGRVVPRSTILEVVWGDVSDSANASLDVIMGRIRRKLGAEVLRTVRGEGYAIDG
ncbi:MAG TPA: response regulator transcription factor [Nannocystaceae bacterium]|nr:response regulator transcription factor [Nannocystaceae bacterium]